MKRIKTFFAICVLSLISYASMYGQDIASAMETYNAGATALKENNYALAIESFSKALKMLEGMGELDEQGAATLKDCKNILPQIYLRYGKEFAAKKDIDNALIQLNKAVESAKVVSLGDVEKEANELIPQVILAGADDNLNLGLFNEALAGYNKVLTFTPNSADVYLRIGVVQAKLNNEEGAVAAYVKAIELGDKVDAPKQLSTMYLKKSSAAFSAKNYTEAISMGKKANEYLESVQGFQLIGLSAMQIKKYDEAIPALEAYLAGSESIKNKTSIFYSLAMAYEAKGNNAKACGYYKKIVIDPKFKAFAENKINNVLKCK